MITKKDVEIRWSQDPTDNNWVARPGIPLRVRKEVSEVFLMTQKDPQELKKVVEEEIRVQVMDTLYGEIHQALQELQGKIQMERFERNEPWKMDNTVNDFVKLLAMTRGEEVKP